MNKLLCILLCCTLLTSCSSDKRLAPKEGRISISPSTELSTTKNTVKISGIQDPEQWHILYQNAQNNRPHTHFLKTNEQNWSVDIGANYNLENLPENLMVVTKNAVYALNGDFNLVKVDRTNGQLLWQKQLSEKPVKNIGLATNGSYIFVVSEQGHLMAINPDGKTIWEKDLALPVRTTPTLNNRLIFVLSSKNVLIALDQKTGKEAWRYQTAGADTFLQGMAHPALSKDVLVVPFTTGEVIAFDATSGMVLWVQMMIGSQLEDLYELPHILAAPIISGDTVYLAGNANLIGAYALQTGKTKWTNNLGAVITPMLSGNALFVLTKQHRLLAIEASTGRVFWNIELPHDKKTVWHKLELLDGKLFAKNEEDLYAIDVTTGKLEPVSDENASLVSSLIFKDTAFALTKRAKLKSYKQGTK